MNKRHVPAAVLISMLFVAFTARAQEGSDAALRLAREGRVDAALAAVEAALSADPENASALFARGIILSESGRPDEAEATFRQLIERHPDRPEGYNNLAVLQAAEGDFDGAVATLKSALATNPSYQTAYENLTRIFAQLASEAYSRALEVESPPARAEVELAMLEELSVLAAPAPAETVVAKAVPAEPLPPAVPEVPIVDSDGAMPETGDEVASADGPATEAVEADQPVLADGREDAVQRDEEAEAAEATDPNPDEAEESMAVAVSDDDDGVEAEDLPMEPETEAPSDEATAAETLSDIVSAWARAWSEQRVDDYLGFYADDYAPDGMSRDDWELNRRERLGTPEFIKVEVAILDSATEGEDRAHVTFLQAYESNTYSDQVTKTLTLARSGSEWKIVEEKSGT